MALFVDGPAVTVDALAEFDSNVLTVAATEGINLTTKILLAHEAMYLDLERLIQRSQVRDYSLFLGQLPRVRNITWSRAMRTWQAYKALALIYRDAYYSQLNDRHQARARAYDDLANTARRELVSYGVGLVTLPLLRPMPPIATLVPATEVGGTYYFSVTIVNDAGQESSPSQILALEVADGNAVDFMLAMPLPQNTTGWNLYAGTMPEQLFRQNDGALVLASDWAYLPSLAITAGVKTGDGQEPDRHWPLHQFLQRG